MGGRIEDRFKDFKIDFWRWGVDIFEEGRAEAEEDRRSFLVDF